MLLLLIRIAIGSPQAEPAGVTPPSDPVALARAELDAVARIEACRAGPCDEDPASLGAAFLTRATASAALRGQVDEVAAANGRLLAPEQAERLTPVLPGVTPAPAEPWVVAWHVAHGGTAPPTPDPPPEPTPPDSDELDLPPPGTIVDAVADLSVTCVVSTRGLVPRRMAVEHGIAKLLDDEEVDRVVARWDRGAMTAELTRWPLYFATDTGDFYFTTGRLHVRHHGRIRGGGRARIGAPFFGRRYRWTSLCTEEDVQLGTIALYLVQRRLRMEPLIPPRPYGPVFTR